MQVMFLIIWNPVGFLWVPNTKTIMIRTSRAPLTVLKRRYSQAKSVLNLLSDNQFEQQVCVKGWIKNLRKQKEITFLDVNDGSSAKNLQVVVHKKLGSDVSVGSSVQASGKLQQTPKGQTEIDAEGLVILGKCDLAEGYPFAPKKEYETEYVREYLHLRPRRKKFAAVLRLRHAATLAIHNHLDERGYFNIHTPIITSNDCEGAGETFKITPDSEELLKSMSKGKEPTDAVYFNKKAYLTVSGQLHLEAAAQALSKVYCFGPTFRAENSKSRFHLSEFYMFELEKAFLDNLDELLDIVEDLIKNVTARLFEKHFGDLDVCHVNKEVHSWMDKPFVRVTHREALEVLSKKLGKVVDRGIGKEHEIALTKFFDDRPVFVTQWPKAEKPFYMKEIPDDKVAAFDLLAPGVGEIAGGSLREHDLNKLEAKIPNVSALSWYLDLRRFGNAPTGGFGLGFERYIQFLLGIDNIKDCIPFPRWPHNCKL